MKKHILKYLLLGTLTVAAMGALAGCGKKEDTSSDTGDSQANRQEDTDKSTDGLVIRVGNCDFAIWNAQYVVAKEKGFFEDEFGADGITVETYNFANGPAGNEAFTAGELDFFNGMGDQPFVAGVGNGVNISILSVLNDQGEGNAIIVKNDDTINDIADLKGKKIGVYIGTQQHKAWLQKLNAAGLSESDVEFVNLTNFSEQYAAFERGEIDTFFATTYNYNSIDDGSVKSIGNFAEFPSRCYLVASTDFIQEYPEITERFLQVLNRAQEYIEENPEESYEILSQVSNLDVDEVRTSNEETKIYLGLDQEIIDGVKDTYSFLKEQGTVLADIDDLDSHFDDSFIKQALGE